MYEYDLIKGLADDYQAPGLPLDLIKGEGEPDEKPADEPPA
jgi:hypothetical protein